MAIRLCDVLLLYECLCSSSIALFIAVSNVTLKLNLVSMIKLVLKFIRAKADFFCRYVHSKGYFVCVSVSLCMRIVVF